MTLMQSIRTWVITIYRQTTLPGLDFTNMTHDGVLATLLSGLEPSVAIVLACIPLLRPLFGPSRKLRENSAGYPYRSGAYASAGGSELLSKKGGIMVNRDFQVLDDETVDPHDGDYHSDGKSSQVELKPIGTNKT